MLKPYKNFNDHENQLIVNTYMNGELDGFKSALNLECGFPGMTSI